MSHSKGILTIAVGKKYARQAIYLAQSCMINSPTTLRAVITNLPDILVSYYDIIIPWHDNKDPFSIKTRLYEFTPFKETLFLDADSLVFNSVDPYFNYLKNKEHYIYQGEKLTDGIWYIDIKKTITIIKSEWIPKFNSGMFLFDKSETAQNIFRTAHHYFCDHKKEGIDIPFFRGCYFPDEPSIAISLALHNIEPTHDYGRFSCTLIKATNIQINVVKRIARFVKDGKFVHPQVVHFCGRFGNIVYTIQKIRLFIYFFNPASKLFFNFLQSLKKSNRANKTKPINTFPNSPNFPS